MKNRIQVIAAAAIALAPMAPARAARNAPVQRGTVGSPHIAVTPSTPATVAVERQPSSLTAG